MSGSRANLLPVGIVLLAFLVRVLALWQYGLHLNLHSDDEGYTQSAIRLLELGRLTYHTANEHTVHMMPGISLLLAAVFAVFGWHTVGLYAAKTVMIGCGCLAVYAVYRIGETLWKPWVGAVAALGAALYVPEVLTDTLLLTEPPFTASFLWMLYFTIRLWQTRRWSYFFVLGRHLLLDSHLPRVAVRGRMDEDPVGSPWIRRLSGESHRRPPRGVAVVAGHTGVLHRRVQLLLRL
jgi:hypothetical protein